MGFTTTATLTLKSIDDFHRVLEFVKPDESDIAPTKKVALFYEFFENCYYFNVTSMPMEMRRMEFSLTLRRLRSVTDRRAFPLVTESRGKTRILPTTICEAPHRSLNQSRRSSTNWLNNMVCPGTSSDFMFNGNPNEDTGRLEVLCRQPAHDEH